MNKKIIVVKALLLFKQNEGLYFLELTRSSKKLVAPGMGDLPGGKVDQSESLEAALMREIKEETGILISQPHKIIDYRWTHDDQEYHEYLYCAFVTTQKVTLALEEHDNYRWVAFNKLNESSLHPNIKKIIESEKARIHKVAENNMAQITFKRMQSSDLKKIAIIGNGGSGKTTVAFKLYEKLGLPIYHLDQYYWTSEWKRVDLEVFRQAHNDLCEKDEWIIEGSYHKLLYHRAISADVIIYLDIPRHKCIFRVIKRAWLNLGKIIPGSPKAEQKLFTFEFIKFLKWIWDFDKRNKAMIRSILNELKDEKKIHILKSQKEIDNLCNKLN